MKLKYFMRGVGVGMIFASLVLFAAYKATPPQMTDQQIRSRAKELGMIEGNNQDASVDALFSTTEDGSEEKTPTTQTSSESITEEQTSKEKIAQDVTTQDKETDKDSTSSQTTDKVDAETSANGNASDNTSTENTEQKKDSQKTNSKKQNDVSDNSQTEEVQTEDEVLTEQADEMQTKDETQNEQEENEKDMITITIPRGTPSERVADQLEKAGIIDDAKKFNDYLCSKGYGSKIITGKYQFHKEETYSSIIKKITN